MRDAKGRVRRVVGWSGATSQELGVARDPHLGGELQHFVLHSHIAMFCLEADLHLVNEHPTRGIDRQTHQGSRAHRMDRSGSIGADVLATNRQATLPVAIQKDPIFVQTLDESVRTQSGQGGVATQRAS